MYALLRFVRVLLYVFVAAQQQSAAAAAVSP
jgi:hypothetical protein